MKIYIMVDIEGISGVYSSVCISAAKGRPDLIAESRLLMLEDVNACIEGCFQGGATEVIVRDCHGGGYNLNRRTVDKRATLINGDTPRVRFADIEGSDGLILLGYHAKAGTLGAVCEHTMSSVGWQHAWINGREVGEIGIDAAIAAEHGVPVIMVSGDDKTCLEAQEWLPDVVTCQVKKGFSCNGASMPSLEETHALITEKTIEAVSKAKNIGMLKLSTPIIYKIEMVSRCRLPENEAYRQIDARTYELTVNSVEKALFFH